MDRVTHLHCLLPCCFQSCVVLTVLHCSCILKSTWCGCGHFETCRWFKTSVSTKSTEVLDTGYFGSFYLLCKYRVETAKKAHILSVLNSTSSVLPSAPSHLKLCSYKCPWGWLSNYWFYLLLIRNRWVVKGSLFWHNWSEELHVSALAITSVTHHSHLPLLLLVWGSPSVVQPCLIARTDVNLSTPMSSLPLCPPGQLFLRLGQSELFWGWEPAIGTVQIPCDTSGSFSGAVRDLLTAWQTWVTQAPVLQLYCCPAVLGCASPALLDHWKQHVQMELSLWHQIHGATPEKFCSQEKIPPASALEQRKIWMWSNVPAKDVHASNWWLASFLAALLW